MSLRAATDVPCASSSVSIAGFVRDLAVSVARAGAWRGPLMRPAGSTSLSLSGVAGTCLSRGNRRAWGAERAIAVLARSARSLDSSHIRTNVVRAIRCNRPRQWNPFARPPVEWAHICRVAHQRPFRRDASTHVETQPRGRASTDSHCDTRRGAFTVRYAGVIAREMAVSETKPLPYRSGAPPWGDRSSAGK